MERLGSFISYLTGRSSQAQANAQPVPTADRRGAAGTPVQVQVHPVVAPSLSQALAMAQQPPDDDSDDGFEVVIHIRNQQDHGGVQAGPLIHHAPGPDTTAPPPPDHVAIDIRDATPPPPADDEPLEPNRPLVIHSPADHRRPAYQRDVVRFTTRADGQRYPTFIAERADIELGQMPRQARYRALRQSLLQQDAEILRMERVVHEMAHERAAPPPLQITPEQTRATGWKVGRRLALRDAISQAAGRVSGLAATAGMRVAAASSDAAARNVGISGAVALVGACVVFGSRMSELLVKGFNIRDRRAMAQIAFALTPFLLQAGMPLIGGYFGKPGTGIKLLATIVGRLIAALVRDGLTQCQAGRWSAFKVVRPDGKAADPMRVINEMDPRRLDIAFTRYVASSLLLLVGGRSVLESWIKSDGSGSFDDLMRTGMSTVIPSVLNEAFDGLNAALAQASAAIDSRLALQYVPANPCAPCDPRTGWGDLASRIRNHAGARMVFGTFTSDPWVTGAEMYADTSLGELAMRLIGGALNGLTEYRGYSIERGNRPEQLAAQRQEEAEQEAIDAATRSAILGIQSGKFQRMRQDLFVRVRTAVLADNAVQADDMPILDAVIEEVYGPEINEAAAEVFMAQSRDDAAREREGHYEIFYGRNDGILEFVPITPPAAGNEDSPMPFVATPGYPTPPQTMPSSPDTSRNPTPQVAPVTQPRPLAMPGVHPSAMEDPGTPIPTAVPPRHLREGQTAWVDGLEVRFHGFAASAQEHKGVGAGRELMVVSAAEPIEDLSWPMGQQDEEGRWVYKLSWQRHYVSGTPPRR